VGKILFITGTDTGAGKTLLTGLLLAHLRDRGVAALAMKPFCSGTLADVRLLNDLQNNELPRSSVNPFYFPQPVAPLAATGKHSRSIRKEEAVDRIWAVAKRCEFLLVEGSGGLMVPLGKDFMVIDLIKLLASPVLIAARNRLGVINHTLLTIRALAAIGISPTAVALMGCKERTLAARTNPSILAELLKNIPVIAVPYLCRRASDSGIIRRAAKKNRKVLAEILQTDNFTPAFGTLVRNRA
jgi:dethiobiotin synthetase